MSQVTKGWIDAKAATLGLLVARWSPGDGRTRYRFARRREVSHGWGFHGPQDGIFTALGIEQARQFLVAYELGYRSCAH